LALALPADAGLDAGDGLRALFGTGADPNEAVQAIRSGGMKIRTILDAALALLGECPFQALRVIGACALEPGGGGAARRALEHAGLHPLCVAMGFVDPNPEQAPREASVALARKALDRLGADPVQRRELHLLLDDRGHFETAGMGKVLPGGFRLVPSHLWLDDEPFLERLPDSFAVERELDLTGCQGLQKLPEGLSVGGGLALASCHALRVLPRGLRVGGCLDMRDCPAWDGFLPDDAQVGGVLVDPGILQNPAAGGNPQKGLSPEAYRAFWAGVSSRPLQPLDEGA
jgi:hypothetical protein